MEYFRSLGTSLLQQSGVVLPFALGERVTSFDREGTIWTLWDAVKRVSAWIFSFSVSEVVRGSVVKGGGEENKEGSSGEGGSSSFPLLPSIPEALLLRRHFVELLFHFESVYADLLSLLPSLNFPLQDDSTPISVFSFDASTPFAGRPDRRTFLPIAKNALKKIRSTRHPDMYVRMTFPKKRLLELISLSLSLPSLLLVSISLKFIDAHETESTIYIATERVKPLCSILSDATSVKLEEEYIMWGLQKITVSSSNSLSLLARSLSRRAHLLPSPSPLL